MVAVDLDGDQDIVVNGSSSALDGGGLSLLLNRGDGAFVERVEIAPFSGPFEVDSADINGDGIPDLVSQTANSIEVYINNGLADFALQQSIPATTGGCELVDLNGDLAVDLVIAMPNVIDVYINTGGVFQFLQT